MQETILGLFSGLALDTSETSFALIISLLSLIILYAMTLMNNKIKMLESEQINLTRELSIQSEELENLARIASSIGEDVKIEMPD